MTRPPDDGSLRVDQELVPPRRALGDRAESARAAARQRRLRAWRYQLTGAVIVLILLLGGIWQVWRTSEIRAVRSHPASASPSALPLGSISAAPVLAWRTSDQLATGQASYQDVVVTYSGRTVNGRDATTGAVRWSYTRTDRQLCATASQDGAVIAVYAHNGLCDEVTGLDAGTGERIWVRTLLTSITPETLTISTSNGNVLLAAPGSLELIEPTGGLDWWLDTPTGGCSNRSAVLGVSGVLIASRCLSGDTVSLRKLDTNKQRAWTVALSGRSLLSADSITAVIGSDGRTVDVLNVKDGTTRTRLTLPTAVIAADSPVAYPAEDNPRVELIAIRNGTIALAPDATGGLLWNRAGPFPAPGPTAATLMSAIPGGVAEIDVLRGSTVTTYRLAGVTGDERVLVVGRGVLVAGTAGTAVYR